MSNNIDKELLKLQNNNKFIVEGEKATLLLSEDTSNTQVLRDLGWDEEIQKKEAIVSKAIETKHMIAKFGENIFNQDKLEDFCIDNNYAFSRLGDYKGPIPKELIAIIKEYSEQNKTHVGNLKDQLLILAPYDYFKKGNNYRADKKLQQILVIEKVSQEHRGNNETFYKIIDKAGTRSKVKEFFKSLYQTHVAQTNQLRYTGFYGIICFIISLFSYFNKKLTEYTIYVLPILFLVAIVVLIVKIFIPTDSTSSKFLNKHQHNGLLKNEYDSYGYTANFIKSNNLKIKVKYAITCVASLLLFITFCIGLRHFAIMKKFDSNNTTRLQHLVGKCDNEHKEYINNSTIYHYIFYDKTSKFDYKVSEHHYDSRTKKFLD